MQPTHRRVAFVVITLGILLTFVSAGEVKVEKSKTHNGDQRGLLPTLGLLALLRMSRPSLFSGGFHAFGAYGTAGAYFHPHPGYYPIGAVGGVGAIGAGTGVAGLPGYPGYPLGFPGHPLGVGPFGINNIRGVYPTNAVPTSSTFNDLRVDENTGNTGTTAKPSYFQYLQEAASPYLHAGQTVQSRHFS
ncbi:uncharacterized protein LOC132205318 isoform X2 [Neocloeon triangulifer]|uniref:uncharacterized protein LOC132205318 isoform X2 n=1 Tax=Neocloeon triangulifer TaxID=2078957 RepID=UPI00286FA90C|nr:uncharacterized protein LOC132205318 isoform X2 [Neocloeon triangulifer]